MKSDFSKNHRIIQVNLFALTVDELNLDLEEDKKIMPVY